MIVIFNADFANALGSMLQNAYTQEDNDILEYLTSSGTEAMTEYLSIARRNRPKKVNIRHFFNAYIFETAIKDEFNRYKGTAEKRFKGIGWQQDELKKVYEVFNKDTSPILLDLGEFHNRLNMGGELLYSTNLKICLSVMVDKTVKDYSTYTELDDIIYKWWLPNEIISKVKIHGQIQLSEHKIRNCLERHTKEKPVLFIKDDTETAYRINWDKLILYENQHINIAP